MTDTPRNEEPSVGADRSEEGSSSGWTMAAQRLRQHATSTLAMLLALSALASLYASDGLRQWRLQEERVREASREQVVTMADVRWKLIELRPLRPREYADADPQPPAGVKLVRMRVALNPSTRAASRRIRGCTLRVYDDRGRYWTESDHVPYGVTPSTETDGCTAGFEKLFEPGKTVELLEDVAVPADARGLRAAVALAALESKRQRPQVAKFHPGRGVSSTLHGGAARGAGQQR